MSDRGEFAIGPGAAKRMRACAWPSIRPPKANLTAMGEGAWERRPFIVSADDRATGASDRPSRTRARSGAARLRSKRLDRKGVVWGKSVSVRGDHGRGGKT